MSTGVTTYTCRCGEIDGTNEHCLWTGELSGLVLVEYMPEHLRSSHAAARNSGVYPHNGAVRVAVERTCADRLREGTFGEAQPPDGCTWFEILPNEDPTEYAECA